MNILYLHQYFTTPEHIGGVRSYQFARRLVEAGHGVDMITSTAFFPVQRRSWWRWVSQHDVDGIKVHAIHVEYGNHMGFTRRILAFLLFMLVSSVYALSLPRRNLVYASSTPLTIAVPALVYCAFKRAPMVFEVRDLWPDIPIAMGVIRSKFLIKLLYGFERHIYRVARKVVVLSSGMRDELLIKKVAAEKIVVIPNACDLDEFAATTPVADPFQELRNLVGWRICIYAGTFGYVNNLDYLLDLAGQIKACAGRVKFILVGDGMEKQHLLQRIVKEELQEYVIFMPAVSKRELIGYLKAADACLSIVRNVPELYNNSANKFFDSLAAGKPIIINHGGWQAKVIEENGIGLVLGQNKQDSALRLLAFLETLDQLKEEHILTVARKYYSREKLFTKLCAEAICPSALL
ncbi:glycosyltransferase family 4 protein [Pseudomonas peli]|uniref:glycosyltransferase family 4 protein n=1 Tax=Pseudomonas peli TaxID=592361 RepID=UPI003D320BD2